MRQVTRRLSALSHEARLVLVQLAGFLAAVVGISLIYVPAGLIVGGVALVLAMERQSPRPAPPKPVQQAPQQQQRPLGVPVV